MNNKTVRWIKSSIYKHFKQKIQIDNSLTVYFEEGEYIDSLGNLITKLPKWAEIDLDGPDFNETTKSKYIVTVTVSVMVMTKKNTGNIYDHDSNVGVALSAFTSTIEAFQLNDGNALIGCFNRQGEAITINDFGRLVPALNLAHSAIQAEYKMFSNL